jgi:cytoskeletal protein CcmA (bactofilin family)
MRSSLVSFGVIACLAASRPFLFGAPAETEERLIDLAQRHFEADPLANSETFREFFQNAEAGRKTDLRTKDPDPRHLDPALSETWSKDRSIPAEWIAWLCRDPKASAKVAAELELVYTRIVGDLNLNGVNVPFSLVFFECAFTGPIFFNQGSIQGLRLQSSCIQRLHATSLFVKHDLTFSEGFQANGTVWLRNAAIDGTLMCDRAHFQRDPPRDPPAPFPHGLDLKSAKIKGDLSLKQCSSAGVVVLDGAQIDGDVDLEGATIDGRAKDQRHPKRPDDNAIFAPSMRIGGGLRLSEKFNAYGQVNISGTTMRGSFDCHDGTFANGDETSLFAVLISVGADVTFTANFVANGEVDLRGATIGGNLDCEGHLSAANGAALSAVSAKIGGSVLLHGDFTAAGVLDFSGAFIDRSFTLQPLKALGTNTTIILQDAKAGVLNQMSSPTPGNLNLDGFIFSSLDSPATATFQKQWLLRQKDAASSQPYEQIASVLRAMGLEDHAREILIAKNDEQRKKPQGFGGFIWYQLFGRFIGYGYHPWSAFYASLFFIVLGYVLFRLGKLWNLMTPTKAEAYLNPETTPGQLTELYPTFNAFFYSLETFVPFLHLNLSDHWTPNPNRRKTWRCLTINGRALRIYLWFHIVIGFALTTLWVGGLTGLIKT